MRSYTRMKRFFLDALLWMYLFQFGLTVQSLEPGFLDFDNLPETNFTCVGKVIGGYYADLEANCQMFHVCTIGQADEPMDIRFLCLNGTVFDQETRVCERIDEVDCSKSEQFYSLNLELYGNSGPILEESPEIAQETEPPSIIIKSTTATTSTTTPTTKRPMNRPTSPPYYTTNRPHIATTAANKPQVVSTHHFPLNAPDIRFNPEEINISLNPGAPPDIRTKHYLPQSFSDNSQDLVNDNADSDEGQSVKVQKPERPHVTSSTSPKSEYAIDNSDNENLPQNSEVNYGFSEEEYQTEVPQRQQQFLIQTNSFRHSQSFPPNAKHNSNQYHHQHFPSTTVNQLSNSHQDPGHTTARTIYLHSLKPPEVHQHHHYTHHHRTERPPQRVQIPIPLLPTLPPLTFSSPAPFTLQRHIENKRYTKDHQAPPRIIISASASVSDASGRRLNYSLGTIGAAQILKTAPSSYDDYKDSDVVLDPFYHDVPKLNQKRRKRRSAEQTEPKINPFDIIKNEKEAVDVLKFLFTWYQSHQATATVPSVTSPISSDLIHTINHEFAPKNEDSALLTDSSEILFTSSKEFTSTESLKPDYENSELFKKSGRYSIVGGYRNLGENNKKSDLNDKSNLKEANINFLNIHPNKIRNGKSIEIHDEKPEIASEISELKEKIDDAEVTVLKDIKQVYFNPYDYVDDNYEGVTYKENNSSTIKDIKTPYQHLDKKVENEKNVVDSQNKNYSVDPKTVLKLYEYFNVSNNVTTETFSTENQNTDNFKPRNTNQNKENYNPTKSLENNISAFYNDTENPKELVKFTEINVLSEVHEDEIPPKSSSTTSTISTSTTTTTTARPYLRRAENRRSRGRQKQHFDQFSHSEKDKNIFWSSTETPKDNGIFKEQDLVTRPSIKRGRKRGRSRFVDYYSSTTTESSYAESILMQDTGNSNLTTVLSSSTEAVSILPQLGINSSPKSVNTFTDKLKETNLNHNAFHPTTTSESFTTEQQTQFDNADYTESILKEETFESVKPLGKLSDKRENLYNKVKDKYSDDVFFYDDRKYQEFDNRSEGLTHKNLNKNDTALETQENLNNDSNTKNSFLNQNLQNESEKNIPTENIDLNSETISTTDSKSMITETSTELPNKHTENYNENKDTVEYMSNLKYIAKTTESSSYLIKLLRYFAETALPDNKEIITTVAPSVSYEPLTENQGFTTEETVPIYNQDRSKSTPNEFYNGLKKNRPRKPLKVSSTELPTLRDIYRDSSESKDYIAKFNNIKMDDSEANIKSSEFKEKNAYSSNTVNITEFKINIPDSKLEENQHEKTKLEFPERLSLIDHILTKEPPTKSVTNSPVADTTATTPFVSFELPESFGTTISSVTNPTKPLESHTEVNQELTQMFAVSTDVNQFTETKQTETNKHYFNFDNDVFVVPELTERNLYTHHQAENRNLHEHSQTDILLDSTSYTNKAKDEKVTLSRTEELHSELMQKIKLESTTPYTTTDFHEAKTPFTIKMDDFTEPMTNTDEIDLTTLPPDVEIQKSISLPVSVLQATFDVTHDINNAQDINELVSTIPVSDSISTLHTTEKLQEFIQEIEASTKSVVSKDSEVKLGFTKSDAITITETVPTTLITTEASTPKYVEEHMKNLKHTIVPEVLHNATEILFIKDTESPLTSVHETTTSLPNIMDMDPPGMVNSSHLLQVVVETTTPEPVTTVSTVTSIPYHTRRTRPPKRRPYTNQRNQFGRHRFSTELFTNRPQVHRGVYQNSLVSQADKENITDAPLHRSATPTRSELKKVSLLTTPLSSKNSHFPTKVSKHYVFNCFGKDIDKFYPDPRDCRLFHYCTKGYSKNQLLDLKFVCDQKTFFDDEKLICTKVKPTRCL